jgi:hypothetical protein
LKRADFFRTMTAYAGTYKIDGSAILHNIFKKQGDRLELSTPPYRFSGDGRMIINSLVWEKVKKVIADARPLKRGCPRAYAEFSRTARRGPAVIENWLYCPNRRGGRVSIRPPHSFVAY